LSMETKTYRGRTLDEILPQIKRELGPDAVITRQRNGLTGGVGGFFQRECIEVEAHAAERAFDAYDDETAAMPPAEEESAFTPDPLPPGAATSEGMSSRAIQEMLEQAAPFADPEGSAPRQPEAREQAPFLQHLSLATREHDAPQTNLSPAAKAIGAALAEASIDSTLASELVADTVTHELPFASPRSLKRLVRAALARRIPIASATGSARVVAFVGSGGAGKTLCAARAAAAYAAAGGVELTCLALRPRDGGGELRSLLESLGAGVLVAMTGIEARALIEGRREPSVVVVDTPAVSARSEAGIDELAGDLRALGDVEVHLSLPSSSSAPATRALLESLGPLGVSRLALTHVDDSTDVGGAVDTAIKAGIPFSYFSSGSDLPGGLEPASAEQLAAWVVP